MGVVFDPFLNKVRKKDVTDLTATNASIALKQDFPLRETMVDANKVFTAGKTQVYTTVALTAARTLTLPAANAFPAGTVLIFVDEVRGITLTNTVTITRVGADVINGASTLVFKTTGGAVRMITDGVSKWTASADVTYSDGEWTPTWTGFSAIPTVVKATYTLVGDLCTVDLYFATSHGTSNSTVCTLTLPFLAKETARSITTIVNSGAIGTGAIFVNANSNVLTAYSTVAGAAFAATGSKSVYLGGFSYKITA